jgi:hypothetical protein
VTPSGVADPPPLSSALRLPDCPLNRRLNRAGRPLEHHRSSTWCIGEGTDRGFSRLRSQRGGAETASSLLRSPFRRRVAVFERKLREVAFLQMSLPRGPHRLMAPAFRTFAHGLRTRHPSDWDTEGSQAVTAAWAISSSYRSGGRR